MPADKAEKQAFCETKHQCPKYGLNGLEPRRELFSIKLSVESLNRMLLGRSTSIWRIPLQLSAKRLRRPFRPIFDWLNYGE
jgi:hypothetical protein